MAELPPIESSIQTYFWLSGAWQSDWPSGWVRRQVLDDHIQERLISTLGRFGSRIARPYPELAAIIVTDLITSGVAQHINNPVSGDYYSINRAQLETYRAGWLSRDSLKAQIDAIGASLFDDIFAVYASGVDGVLPFDSPESVAPASDRVVRFSDNQEEYQDVVTALEVFTVEFSNANDFGDMSESDVEVARSELNELSLSIKSGIGRPRRIWAQARSTLSWIGKQAAAGVIGAAALALLGLIYHFLQAFF